MKNIGKKLQIILLAFACVDASLQAFTWPTRAAILAKRPEWVTRLCNKVEKNPQKYAFFSLGAALAVGALWYKGVFSRTAKAIQDVQKPENSPAEKPYIVTATVAEGRAEDFGYRAMSDGIEVCVDANKNSATLNQRDGWRCGYYAFAHAGMYILGKKQLIDADSNEYFLGLQKYVANYFRYQDSYQLLGGEIERIRDELYPQFKDVVTVLDHPNGIETLEVEKIEQIIGAFSAFFSDKKEDLDKKIQHVFICNTTYPVGCHWVAIGVTREANSQQIKVDWMDSHGNGGAQVASTIADILRRKEAYFAAWKEGCRQRMIKSVSDDLNQQIGYFTKPIWMLDSCVEVLKDPTKSHGFFAWLKRRFGRSSETCFTLCDGSKLFLNTNQMNALEQGYKDTYIFNKSSRTLVAKNYSCEQKGVLQYKTEFVTDSLNSVALSKRKEFVFIPGECARDCAIGVDQAARFCQGRCKAGQWQNVPQIQDIYSKIQKKLIELFRLDKAAAGQWLQNNLDLLEQNFTENQIGSLLNIIIESMNQVQ